MKDSIIKLHPLVEVFGFPTDNFNPEAVRSRKHRLCPFFNRVPNCTKDKAKNPLGVCSIFEKEEVAITCPVRFRENWLIAEDAAEFFFPPGTKWTTLTEVRLNDKEGKTAGNIDVVVLSYDEAGHVTDFGALEVQAVYISGNVRNVYEYYIKDPKNRSNMDWTKKPNYPRPDYLSSSRKRLAPQLIFKGGILNAWKKKTAVAMNKGFYETLPTLSEVPKSEADIAWMVYDLKRNSRTKKYNLVRDRFVYTKFEDSLMRITRPQAGNIEEFIGQLQEKLDEKLDGHPPDTEICDAPF